MSGCRWKVTHWLTDGIRGSGTIVTEARPIGGFDSLEVSQIVQARFEPGEEPRLTVECDDNLLRNIVTRVEDGRLKVFVEANQGISPSQPIRVEVRGAGLKAIQADGASRVEAKLAPEKDLRISASGAAKVQVESIEADGLRLECSGASHMEVKGKAQSLEVEASGASRVQADGLIAEKVRHRLSGASNADVHANASVEGEISGASRVVVHGNPAIRKVGTSGASSVKYMGGQAERE
jgi:hypothetical protein